MAACQTLKDEGKNNPFGFAAQPCTFPPGTDQKIIKTFDSVDKDCNGFIDEGELKKALTKCNLNFKARTVRFFMCTYSNDTTRVAPKEFVDLFNSLKRWRDAFCKADKDRDGFVDGNELRTALNSLGFPLSAKVVNLMIALYIREKRSNGVPYDKFIECCVIVKGLSEAFKQQESSGGSATFTYETFMQAALLFTAA